MIEYTLGQLFSLNIEFFSPDFKDTPATELRVALRQIGSDMTADICLQLNIIAFCSYKFCTKFVENQSLAILYKYLTCDIFLDAYDDAARDTKSKRFITIDSIMRRTIGALVCMARTYSSFKNDWKAQNSVEKFLKYLERTRNIVDNKIYTCMAIAFVADDEDKDNLPQLKEIIPDLAYMAGVAAISIKDKVNLKRQLVQLDETGNVTKEVGL